MTTTNHPDPTPPTSPAAVSAPLRPVEELQALCDRTSRISVDPNEYGVASAEFIDEIDDDFENWCVSPEAADFIETAKILAEPYNEKIAALTARLAAADRENAELRAVVAEAHLVCDDLGAQVRNVRDLPLRVKAAAEAQCDELREDVERLRELVRANAHAVLTFERERNSARAQLAAAQAQLAGEQRVHEFAQSQHVETFAKLSAAEARLEAVRVLAHASKHVGGFGRLNADDVLAALSAAPQPEPEAMIGCACGHTCDHGPHDEELDHDPEPPASDEPARCSTCGGSFDSPGCCKSPGDDRPRAEAGFHTIDGGPAASGTPDGGS